MKPLLKDRTLAEVMALAVLRGDDVAALALADQLLNDHKSGGRAALNEAAKILRETHHGLHDGYAVYAWPEFRAFAKRLGFLYDHRTVSLTITLQEGQLPTIYHEYQAVDTKAEIEVTQNVRGGTVDQTEQVETQKDG